MKCLLLLAWLAIAALGYYLWEQNETQAHRKAVMDADQARIGKLEAKVSELNTKILEVDGIRELQRLANEAIAEGHRSSLYKLDQYVKNPEIQALQQVANAEIIRVESYFVTTRPYRGFPEEMPFISEADPVGSLAGILSDSNRHWALRARAATLLGEYPKDTAAADALAEASELDPSLYVVHEAILAFAKVTGFRSSAVFDSSTLRRWWANHRSDLK